MAHRFPIGTQYRTSGKHPDTCTVVDQLTTRNAAGEVVRERYVSTHEFLGQVITDHDVVDTTIARGLLPAFVHLLGA